eukprot:jgi/Galph1/4741/GphlegSOOS_G3333.1
MNLLFWRIFTVKYSYKFFRGKHVFITGASSGIGKALAIHLATKKGARVSLAARSVDKLEKLQQEIQRLGGQAQVIPLDICDPSSFLKKIQQSVDSFQEIDILIANAAVNNQGLSFLQLNEELIRQVLETNFGGNILFIRQVLLRMQKNRKGQLVGISSLAGYRGLPMGSIYGATKAALTNFLESLQIELYGCGIDVTVVHPGFIDTPAIEGMKHPKPFLLSSETAARKIANAIILKKYHYGFPWIMENIIIRVAQILPDVFYVPLLYF